MRNVFRNTISSYEALTKNIIRKSSKKRINTKINYSGYIFHQGHAMVYSGCNVPQRSPKSGQSLQAVHEPTARRSEFETNDAERAFQTGQR